VIHLKNHRMVSAP